MAKEERQIHLQLVTRKLVGLTIIPLLIIFVVGYFYIDDNGSGKVYLVSLVFIAGLVGGFVSLQQRLPSIETNELKSLSSSWLSILLVPINGGIFALVLMVMFLAGLIEGAMFPKFHHFDFNAENQDLMTKSVYLWFTTTYPSSGTEIGKLLFWSFVAGFSERFVPQIIRKTTNSATEKTGSSDKQPAKPDAITDEDESKRLNDKKQKKKTDQQE